MLVFRRQQGESFMVGDAVEVRILDVRGGQVKIGVLAPREIGIYRIEISRLNQRAALTDVEKPQVKSVIAAAREVLLGRQGGPGKLRKRER